VKRRLDPIFEIIAPFAPILTKRLDASSASCSVDQGASKHPPDNVDAIKDVRLRDDCRLDPHSGERVSSRLAAGKLTVCDVVRKVVLPVFVSTGDALFKGGRPRRATRS
jgi:hypothetical protein